MLSFGFAWRVAILLGFGDDCRRLYLWLSVLYWYFALFHSSAFDCAAPRSGLSIMGVELLFVVDVFYESWPTFNVLFGRDDTLMISGWCSAFVFSLSKLWW